MRRLRLRRALFAALLLLAPAALAGTADAEVAAAGEGKAAPSLGGQYEVKFDEVANNCQGTGMNLRAATIELTEKRKNLTLTIPLVPVMSGTIMGDGKFQAAARRGRTAIEGIDGKFSAAGRVDKGLIQLVFIAEYFRGKAPLCTQSWNVSGLRKDQVKR
jgi:hypothetical protein